MAALITTPRLMAVGGGALADLPGLMARLGLSRPLIVTDPYIAGCGILDRATALLDGAVTQQAAMIAYIDDFYLMLLLTLAALPLLLLVRPPRGAGVKHVAME